MNLIPIKKSTYRLKSIIAIGATDILVGFVVASILGILIYNIHLKYTSSKKSEFISSYLKENASHALNEITKDFLNSTVNSAGCKNVGIIKPKYGGITAPDEIFIISGNPLSWETLKEDMQNESSTLTLKLGHQFRLKQKAAICDDSSMEWFTIGEISNMQDKGLSIIFPERSGNGTYLSKAYKTGATIGAFSNTHYYIEKSKEGSPVLTKKLQDQEEKVIAADIENLKFEYFIENSEIPVLEPASVNTIKAVKVTVVARSSEQDTQNLSGVNSLTGEQDGYSRLNLSTKFVFDPPDMQKIKDLSFRIMKNSNSEDIPEIIKGSNKM